MPSVRHSLTALRSLRRRLSRLSTGVGAAVTVALLVAAVTGAMRTLPALDRGGSLTFDIDDAGRPLEHIRGARLAVFSVGRDGTARRVGQARATGRGALEIQLYENAATRRPQSVAVLLQADGRLLWAFTSDADKAKIRHVLEHLVGEAQSALKDIIDSDTFREKHQPMLQAVVRRAFEQAAGDPEVQQALAGLPPLQEVFDPEFVAGYLAIVARNSVRHFGDFVGALTRTLWEATRCESRERSSTRRRAGN